MRMLLSNFTVMCKENGFNYFGYFIGEMVQVKQEKFRHSTLTEALFFKLSELKIFAHALFFFDHTYYSHGLCSLCFIEFHQISFQTYCLFFNYHL